jgi:hypothetical protein
MTKLTSNEAYRWLVAFRKFLRKENPWGKFYGFRPWKTLTVGDLTKRQLVERMKPILDAWRIATVHGDNNRQWHDDTVAAIRMHQTKERIDLFKVDPIELGIEERVSGDFLRRRLQEVGFDVCPQETAYRLLLEFEPTPGKDTWVQVISEAILPWPKTPTLVYVGNNQISALPFAYPMNEGTFGPKQEIIVGRFRH